MGCIKKIRLHPTHYIICNHKHQFVYSPCKPFPRGGGNNQNLISALPSVSVMEKHRDSEVWSDETRIKKILFQHTTCCHCQDCRVLRMLRGRYCKRSFPWNDRSSITVLQNIPPNSTTATVVNLPLTKSFITLPHTCHQPASSSPALCMVDCVSILVSNFAKHLPT